MSEPEDWTYRPAEDMGLKPLDRLRSVQREPGLFSCITHAATARCLRTYFQLCHRLRVVGRENLPTKPPFVMIANHASHFDSLIMSATLGPRIRARTFSVAAGDVFFTSVHRTIFASFFINALPLWRKKVTTHALAGLRSRLEEGGCGLILFPEGARSRDGALLPFKQGLGMIVASTTVPVIPCRIDGAFEALRPETRLPRFKPITLHVGTPIDFATTSNDREGWRSVATTCESAIRSLGRP